MHGSINQTGALDSHPGLSMYRLCDLGPRKESKIGWTSEPQLLLLLHRDNYSSAILPHWVVKIKIRVEKLHVIMLSKLKVLHDIKGLLLSQETLLHSKFLSALRIEDVRHRTAGLRFPNLRIPEYTFFLEVNPTKPSPGSSNSWHSGCRDHPGSCLSLQAKLI